MTYQQVKWHIQLWKEHRQLQRFEYDFIKEITPTMELNDRDAKLLEKLANKYLSKK